MERRTRQLDQENQATQARLAGGGNGPHVPAVEPAERLAKLETSVDWIKVIGAILMAAIGLLTAVTIAGFTFLATQTARLETRVDAIPHQLSEEFRAMRAEMSAQTAAIANSITATKQVQPQIVVVPMPAPAPPKP